MAEIRMYTKEELAQMPFGEIVDYINKLYEEYHKYKNKALYKEHSVKYQKDEIVKLNNLLFEKNRTIEEQVANINDMDSNINRYQLKINDLEEEIRKLKEQLNSPIGYLDLELVEDKIGYAPTNFELAECENHYSPYAKHLMRKYEALTDAGFSHDDAMSLIPMWDDADFEEFKEGN